MKRLLVQFRNQTINMSLPEFGVLSAIISVVDRTNKGPNEIESTRLELGGLDSTDGKHPSWGTFDLDVGDSVTISIHGDRISDEPVERTGNSVQHNQSLVPETGIVYEFKMPA
jgi:hypothetical protein